MPLHLALRRAVTTDPTLQALDASETGRLEALIDFIAEALPQENPQEALRFSQRVLNQQSLVMKRDAHGLREGWLTPEDRMLLSQQEVDWTALGHLVRAGYVATYVSALEPAAQADPLPLSASDHHHPADLHPSMPWMAERARLSEDSAAAVSLVHLFQAGDLRESPWEQRHAVLPTVIEVLARDHETAGAQNALMLGYAGFLARQMRLKVLSATANHALDPGALLNTVHEEPWQPPTFHLEQYLGELTTAGHEQGLLPVRDVAARLAVQQGYGLGVLENALTNPLPAGR